ncbi:MAG: hypothetical protein A3I00_10130 [Betaproteobacteria bacterium RIFCSPLOWO2_02_FULL_64_12]|nr:MAG: hypothetical protein A3I00_10130 [Betaproteobacteria bacterium RIFCSPLOWO2_02_FULL_64_12]
MIVATLRGSRFPIETALLAALAFFLPLLEAPKNIVWLAWVLTWLFNRVRSRDFGARWDAWDSLILLWIVSPYIAAAFAGLHANEWRGSNDVLRYGLVLWLVKRGGYGEREVKLVLSALAIAVLVGLPGAYIRLADRGWLEMHSVGQVNHTAIYLDIILGMCVAWLLAEWRSLPRWARVVGIAVIAAFGASVIASKSRAAVGVAVIMLLLLALVWRKRSWRPLAVLGFSIVISLGATWAARLGVVTKHLHNVEVGDTLAYRDKYWSTGIAAWQRFPLFGVGMENYSVVTVDMVQSWREEAGKPFNPDLYWRGSHGHSLYLNTLTERGAFGFLVLMAVLCAWLASLIRGLPRAEEADLKWVLWGGAFSAWFVTVGAGLVNTSLHHEHAILSVMLLGLWLAYRTAR